MQPRSLAFAAVLTASAIVRAEPGAFDAHIAKQAAQLPAGGIVAAEFDAKSGHFTGAGNLEPATKVAPEKVIFEIGSITKVFTALVLAETVHEGKAKLDDPIAKFLPPDLKLSPEVAAITLEQLSTHTSGLPRMPADFAPRNPANPYADYGTKELYATLRAQRLDHPAPFPADYSNYGQGLLGHILTLIHRQSYERLLAERISGPLGLADTVITLNAEQQARFAAPHSGSRTVSPWTLDAHAGAGAIRSTAADLVKLAQTLMTPGDTPVQRAWTLVRKPRVDFDGQKLGLAIVVGQLEGATAYSHGGGTGGFRTLVEFTPEKNRGIVILINNDAVEPGAVYASYRGKLQPAAPGTEREEVAAARERLAEFPAVYALSKQAKLTVLPAPDGKLQVRLTGQPFFPIFYAGNDRFFLRVVAAEIQFARDAAGKVVSATLLQNGRELLGQRTTDPLPTVHATTAEEIAPYAGDFQLGPNAVFEVRPRGDNLFVKLSNQPSFPVFKERADHFAYDVVEAALTFERDADGKVVAVVLHQNGMDQRARRVK